MWQKISVGSRRVRETATGFDTNQFKIDLRKIHCENREYERLVVEREAQLKQGETAVCITDLFLEEAARLVFPSRCFRFGR